MSVRIGPPSPGCCLLSLFLLPFHILFVPFRILIGGPRVRYRVGGGRYRQPFL